MISPGRGALLGLGAIATSLAVVLAQLPGPVDLALDGVFETETAATAAATRRPVATLVQATSALESPRAALPTRARLRVVDVRGRPVVGITVRAASAGDVVVTDAEGRLPVEGDASVAAPGWLGVRSAVLDLCMPTTANVLLATRAGAIFGMVVAPDGLPVPDASLTLELDVELPPGNLHAAGPLHAVRLVDWRTTSDQGGRFLLAHVPVGDNTRLRVEHPGYEVLVVEAPAPGQQQRLQLARSESEVADAPAPTPVGEVAGQLVDGEGVPRVGWWVMLVRTHATTFDAARVVGWPVRSTADGRFAWQQILAGSYCVEAFAADNSAVVRSAPICAPAASLRIEASTPRLPTRITGVVRSASGQPQAGARVGLARPTAWAFRGRLGMHAEASGVADARGRFTIETRGFAALDLLVEGATCGVQRWALDPEAAAASLDVVLDGGRRIDFDVIPAALAGATLLARDEAERSQLVTAATTASFGIVAPRLAAGGYDVPPSVRSLVLRSGERDLGHLLFRR